MKFIVDSDAIDALRERLNTLGEEHHAPSQLLNIYYKTPDAWLHGHDMGLRIHGENGHHEMTMKIAGRVTGGLYQRPRYNAALNASELSLTLFPAGVWPDDRLPAELASQVQPLFSTDFYRERWLVDVDGSRIEMTLDLGEVKAGGFTEPICGLGLELLSGDARTVLKLANQLVSQTDLRQGSLGKATRSYHLAQGNAPHELRPTRILKVPTKASVEQGLEAALELALPQQQYHKELWVCGVRGAKAEVLAAVGLVRHTLMLFDGNVPRKTSAHLRDLLTQSGAIVSSDVSVISAVYNAQTAMTKLALTEWLVTEGWQSFLDTKARGKIADSFKRFSDTHLPRRAAELKAAFMQSLGDQYTDQLPRLTRNIDSMLILVGYYDESIAPEWIANWQGLRRATAASQYIEIKHFRSEVAALEPFRLHSGER